MTCYMLYMTIELVCTCTIQNLFHFHLIINRWCDSSVIHQKDWEDGLDEFRKLIFFLICLCITDEQGFFDWFLFIIISINGHHGYTRRSWQLTTRNDSFVLFHENIGSDRWWWIPQLYLFVGCNTQQRRDGEWCCLTSNMGAKGAYMYTYYSIIGNQLAKVDVTGVSHWLVATLVNWHSLFLCCCCSPFVSIVVLRYSR